MSLFESLRNLGSSLLERLTPDGEEADLSSATCCTPPDLLGHRPGADGEDTARPSDVTSASGASPRIDDG